MENGLTYRNSGVNIDEANRFVEGIGSLVKATLIKGALQRKGSFGGLFELPKGYKNPVLVSSTDGVGTKLLIAKSADKHDTVGIDLVAMNVNDVLCCGARPLFFLDYIACGKVKTPVLTDIIKGVTEGCRQAGCALIGGETAEMPGLYKEDEYDLAGFTVGVVEKSEILDGSKIKIGDMMIGLASSGIHSNGYSLARKVFSEQEQKEFSKELLEPTRIYVKPVLAVLKKFKIRGIAHITGGAFYEKLTKVLRPGQCFEVRKGSWSMPEIFSKMQKKGRISDSEMFRTFNMGIGMVLVTVPKDVAGVQKILRQNGVENFVIGKVIKDSTAKVKFV